VWSLFAKFKTEYHNSNNNTCIHAPRAIDLGPMCVKISGHMTYMAGNVTILRIHA